MKSACAVIAGLALSLLPARHELRFAPEPGTELAREVRWTVRTTTESTTTTLGGESTTEVPDVGFEATRTVEVGVTDTLETVEDGRPTRWVREYEDLVEEYGADVTLGFGGQEARLEVSGDGTSALEGGDVRFTWSDGAYEAAWADEDEERDAELLDGLAADMDLLALVRVQRRHDRGERDLGHRRRRGPGPRVPAAAGAQRSGRGPLRGGVDRPSSTSGDGLLHRG